MFKSLSILGGTLAILISTSIARSATIVEYNFNASGAVPSAVADNVTAANFGVGAGITGGHYRTDSYREAGTATVRDYVYTVETPQIASANNPLNIANNDYLEFSVTPSPEYALDLESFSFVYGAAHANNDGNTNLHVYFHVQSSVTGWGNNLAFLQRKNGALDDDYSEATIVLGDEFSGLTEQVTFRIYLTRSDSFTNWVYQARVDDIQLAGEVAAVPEPAMVGLLAMAVVLGGLGRWRRA